MPTPRTLHPPDRSRAFRDSPGLFFRSFLEHPKQVGSVVPSSRFLARRVARDAELGGVRVVVELGPGTGGTTRALLRGMAQDGRLIAIELHPRLAARVRHRIDDPRLIVHQGDARQIAGILAAHGLGPPDVVVSGIPFSTMPRPIALAILRAVREVLAPGGRFVAYQVRDRVVDLAREVFPRPSVARELRNVPPMRIYRFEKGAECYLGS